MSVPERHRGWTAPSATGTIEEGPARAPCTFCRGTGRHTVFERWHSDGRIAERKFQICERCGGRGWVHEGGFPSAPTTAPPRPVIKDQHGKITFGSLEMPLKHPMSIGYGVTVGRPEDYDRTEYLGDYPLSVHEHQEFDRDMIEVRSAGAGGLMIPKALVEDANGDLLGLVKERMAKAQAEADEELAAHLFVGSKSTEEAVKELRPVYGPFAEELVRLVKNGTPLREAHAVAGRKLADAGRCNLHGHLRSGVPLVEAVSRPSAYVGQSCHDDYSDLATALASCAPLANAVGICPPPAQSGMIEALSSRYHSPWATRAIRDDELASDHADSRWERPDDDWEGVGARAKRQILSARRRRALKGNLREISRRPRRSTQGKER